MDTILNDRVLFSVYGISVAHPKTWKLCFDPKRGVSYSSGFFRIEDFVPRKGAQLSLSLNWEQLPGDNESFAEKYCENISEQYKVQMKKSPYQMERMEVIDFCGGKAAFVVSEFRGSLGLVKRASDAPVRVIQLAYYDEDSGRAVVSSLMGRPELVRENEDLLQDLVYSVRCHPSLQDAESLNPALYPA